RFCSFFGNFNSVSDCGSDIPPPVLRELSKKRLCACTQVEHDITLQLSCVKALFCERWQWRRLPSEHRNQVRGPSLRKQAINQDPVGNHIVCFVDANLWSR